MKVVFVFLIAICGTLTVSARRSRRSPQFHQNYHPGSQSQNFNCHFGGCGNIPAMQSIHGGHVFNHGSTFGQNYYGGSSATNYGKRRRRDANQKQCICKNQMIGTLFCTYSGQVPNCKCICEPFTIIQPPMPNPFLSRFSRSPQFHQNYHPGSQSQNFNCHFGGCGNIPAVQSIHGGHVYNQGSSFGQNYFGGSHATNFGRKKRSAVEVTDILEPVEFTESNGMKYCKCEKAGFEGFGTIVCVLDTKTFKQDCQCTCQAFTTLSPTPSVIPPIMARSIKTDYSVCACTREVVAMPEQIKFPGTVVCTYPNGKITCHCTCQPFTVFEPPMLRIWPKEEEETELDFPREEDEMEQELSEEEGTGQDLTRKKRSPQFFQSFAPGSSPINCHQNGCAQAPVWPTLPAMMPTMPSMPTMPNFPGFIGQIMPSTNIPFGNSAMHFPGVAPMQHQPNGGESIQGQPIQVSGVQSTQQVSK